MQSSSGALIHGSSLLTSLTPEASSPGEREEKWDCEVRYCTCAYKASAAPAFMEIALDKIATDGKLITNFPTYVTPRVSGAARARDYHFLSARVRSAPERASKPALWRFSSKRSFFYRIGRGKLFNWYFIVRSLAVRCVPFFSPIISSYHEGNSVNSSLR